MRGPRGAERREQRDRAGSSPHLSAPLPSLSAARGSVPAPADNQGAHLKPRRQTGSLSPPEEECGTGAAPATAPGGGGGGEETPLTMLPAHSEQKGQGREAPESGRGGRLGPLAQSPVPSAASSFRCRGAWGRRKRPPPCARAVPLARRSSLCLLSP